MAKRNRSLSIFLYGLVVATHAMALVLLVLSDRHARLPQFWTAQVAVLLPLSLSALLLALRIPRSAYVYACLLFSFVCISIVGYPYGDYIAPDVLLVLGVTVVVLFRLPEPYHLVFSFALIVASMLLQQPVDHMGTTAFGVALIRLPPRIVIEYAFVVGTLAVSFAFIRGVLQSSKSQEAEIERLYENIGNLTQMNVIFQDKAIEMKEQSSALERKRITREIHDVTGYFFTNILMLLKAAVVLTPTAPEKVLGILHHAISQVQNGLDETRKALRSLNEIREDKSNLSALFELVQTFRVLTNIEVDLQYGNCPATFGTRTDYIVYRVVQESLTNAFRHSKATRMGIHLWLTDKEIVINISDNGKGAQRLVKGMGLTGMEERIKKVNGTVRVGNIPGGFHVSARIPYPVEVVDE